LSPESGFVNFARQERFILGLRILLTALAVALSLPLLAEEAPTYPIHYQVTLNPDKGRAEVVIETDHNGLLTLLDFNVRSERYSDIEANGELVLKNGRALWYPPAKNARMTFNVRINQERPPGAYDALIEKDWAIFRGDNIIPSARVRTFKRAATEAYLTFKLPEHWTGVSTGWDKLDKRRFRVDNPERRFDRPTGWMIAGKLGIRRERLGDTEVVVSAPKGTQLHRMDVLTFLTIAWPEVQAAFGETPPKMLIVGHGDPMWRGGLSASNSLFLHADRALVTENSTSPLLHEVVHIVTRVYGKPGHDWISEGLAEFYSFELLYRAGAMTDARRQHVIEGLAKRGGTVKTLIKPNAGGATTARAVIVFDDLDREIRAVTCNKHNLDQVIRALMAKRTVDLDDLREEAEKLLGKPAKTLVGPVFKARER
jgi:hypothetical protein